MTVHLAICSMVALMVAVSTEGPRSQARPHVTAVAVDPRRIRIMDGDTAAIRWSPADVETVRVLGIDTPELYGSRNRPGGALTPGGAEARGFARGAFTLARRIELRRSAGLDRHGRTLGYFFLDGRNYSVLALEAGLARETVSRYGDNGMPREASEVREAARRGPRPRKQGASIRSPDR